MIGDDELYVEGVDPDELRARLEQWSRLLAGAEEQPVRLRWRQGYGWRRDGEPDGAPLVPLPVPPDRRFRKRTEADRQHAALRRCWEQFAINTAEMHRAALERYWEHLDGNGRDS